MKPAPIGPEGPVTGWQRVVSRKHRVAMEVAFQKAWFKHQVSEYLAPKVFPWMR